MREEGYARTNLPRVNAEWLQRMRALKLDELRNEASALAREHDREVDRRDRLAEVGATACKGAPACGCGVGLVWCGVVRCGAGVMVWCARIIP